MKRLLGSEAREVLLTSTREAHDVDRTVREADGGSKKIGGMESAGNRG